MAMHAVFIRKYEVKRPLERPRSRWEGIVTIDLKSNMIGRRRLHLSVS
jgi:hypothetical protein